MAVVPVANDTRIYASQYNALVTAIQDEGIGHDHTGETDGGKRVSHSDLTDGKMDALGVTSHTHAEIDTHVDAASEVHGLIAGVYVQGVYGAQYVVEFGSAQPVYKSTIVSAQFSQKYLEIEVTTNLSTIVHVYVTKGSEQATLDFEHRVEDCGWTAGTAANKFILWAVTRNTSSTTPLYYMVVGTKV